MASVVGRVREGEFGLLSLDRRVRPGHLAAPDSLQADRSESVRRAAGQYGRTRARGRRAQGKGRIPPLTAVRAPMHILLADRQGRPLRLRGPPGPRHDRTQARALVEAWTVAPLSCLTRGSGRAYAGDALRA